MNMKPIWAMSPAFFTPGGVVSTSVRKIDLSPLVTTAMSRNSRRVVHRVRNIREVTHTLKRITTGAVLDTFVERLYVSDCGGWVEETIPFAPPPGFPYWKEYISLDFTGTQTVTCFSCLRKP